MKKKQLEPLDAETTLREHGFKITPLRIALITILSESIRPLTVPTLVKKTKRLGADTATIYRALQAFVEEELIRSLSLTPGVQSYEFIRKQHTHHIICTLCNSIEAIPFCVRGIEINAQTKSKLFKTISAHTLSFNGTCKKCARAVR